MHVISKKKLCKFWDAHPQAKPSLDAWFRKVRSAEWSDFHDVKEMFPQTDRYDKYLIFDIGGNKYRLIAEVNYVREKCSSATC